MPRPKKRFIDPKRERTTTFALVHRSQRDPLAADSDAPQRVLQEIGAADKRPDRCKKTKKEEQNYGIFYDDDYNYMQHLKDRNAPDYDFTHIDKFVVQKDVAAMPPVSENSLNLPSEVFATRGPEEDVGLLNRAAPCSGPLIDWDPDIVETLDDAFEHEVVCTVDGDEGEEDANELDDIFKAAVTGHSYIDESDSDGGDFSSDFGGRSGEEENDFVPQLMPRGEKLFMEEETRSRFTNYSLSSSAIRRNEQLTLLDDKFENFFAEYDEINMGALDCEDIEGYLDADVVDDSDDDHPEDLVMTKILNDYREKKEFERQKLPDTLDKFGVLSGSLAYDDDGDKVDVLEEERKDRFDCQSILSTYSNLYNHPKLIRSNNDEKIIRISDKTGMPKDVLGKGLTAGALKRLDRENNTGTPYPEEDTQTLASRMSQLSFRNKHETTEEKRARKNAMKELKRERRLERKANQFAFRQEQCRQEKALIHQQRQSGMKIF